MEDIPSLRSKAKELEPLLRIGKNGLTEGMINEIKHMLMKKRMIKIKILRAFFEGKDKDALVDGIVEKTDSVLVECVGNIVVLHKK
jgi:RNA-binding protein